MSTPPHRSQRLLTPLAWLAVIGSAAFLDSYSSLLAMAPYGSAWRTALDILGLLLVVPLWLVVVLASTDGVRRWPSDTIQRRIETIVLVMASLALACTTVLYFVPFTTVWPPIPPLFPRFAFAVYGVFGVAACLALFLSSNRASGFEAIAVPGVALTLPFGLTGVEMDHGTALSIAMWSLVPCAVVSVVAFAITRERVYSALLAGLGGTLLGPFALLAFLVPAVAMLVPATKARAQAVFADGAERIAVFASGLALAACFGGAAIIMLSPTLRSQSEHATFVLTMRPTTTIVASCLVLFALCVLTSPLAAFSLVTAAYAFEVQCSIIGGSVPIAVAATIARAEWQKEMLDVGSRRVNVAAVAVLVVVGCVFATIPHPPDLGGG